MPGLFLCVVNGGSLRISLRMVVGWFEQHIVASPWIRTLRDSIADAGFADEAWEEARKLFPMDDIAIVANED